MKLMEFMNDISLRFDAKAVRILSEMGKSDDKVQIEAVAYFGDQDYSERPENGAFNYYEISSVDDFGLGVPYHIDENYIEEDSEEGRILEKVINGDIAKPEEGSILIPKVRPNLGKFVLCQSNEEYYSRAFLKAKPKGISPHLLYCLLKHPLTINQILQISRIGKGYPTISSIELSRFVRVPKGILAIRPEFDKKIKIQV